MRRPVRTRRPGFGPDYGIDEDTAGLLDWDWAVGQLVPSRNYWVATADGDGRPRAVPVWGLWLDDAVVFGANPRSRKARNLDRDPRAVVHLESGDRVVILEGEAERTALDDRIADAYGRKYDYRPDPAGDTGAWFRLRPRRAYAWLEESYPRTATRFDFEG